MNILIVDDNRDDRELLRHSLNKHGHEVMEAMNGQDGLQMAGLHKPDIIISEIFMPGMDGFNFLRNIKKDEALRQIPFILYSGVYLGDKDKEMAEYLGANAFIEKTGEAGKLLEEINAAIEAIKDKEVKAEIKAPQEEEFLRNYCNIVVSKLEEKIKELEEERNMAQKYLDIAGVIFVIIGADQKIRLINKKGCDIFKCEREDAIGLNWFDTFIPPRIRDELKDAFEKLMQGGLPMLEYHENPVLTSNGEERIIAWRNTLLTNEQGKIYATLSSGGDVTEHRKAEEQIRASLKEKEVLLREIHHRVKNNMQIIISLLRLQASGINDERYLEMFKAAQNRIAAMSLIHEKLYYSDDMARVVFRDYVEGLTSALFGAYKAKEDRIALRLDIGDILMSIDKAIPVGLILNELVTNSFNHAFPGDRTGEIRISMHPIPENKVELIFGDNGIGIPGDMDIINNGSLGLSLVSTLAEEQLSGRVELKRDKGTEFRIAFSTI